jgi:cell division protein FtsN
MPEDYKNINHRKPAPGIRLHGVVPFTTGLMVGLFVAFIVYLNEHQPGFFTPEPPELVIKDTGVKQAESPQEDTPVSNIPEPQFDFYQILPNLEVNVSEWETDEQVNTENLANDSSVYILQVGSFSDYVAADEVKAQLALLGIPADIQRVVINGRDIRHRVRIGPYSDPEKLHEARDRLVENGLEFMLLKLKVDDI